MEPLTHGGDAPFEAVDGGGGGSEEAEMRSEVEPEARGGKRRRGEIRVLVRKRRKKERSVVGPRRESGEARDERETRDAYNGNRYNAQLHFLFIFVFLSLLSLSDLPYCG